MCIYIYICVCSKAQVIAPFQFYLVCQSRLIFPGGLYQIQQQTELLLLQGKSLICQISVALYSRVLVINIIDKLVSNAQK